MINRTILVIGLIVAFPMMIIAAPLITGVTGTVSDGSSITISGSNFTTNSIVGTSNLEFLGGKNGPINSGSSGTEFSRINWSIDPEWGNDIQYSTNNVPWGTHVLQMTGPYTSSGNGNPEAPLYYKFPSAVNASDSLFISWWQRTTFSGNGQYKILRLEPTNTVIDSSGAQDCWFFHNNGGGISYGINGGPYVTNSNYLPFTPASPQSTWQRVDMTLKTSSPNSIVITMYTPGSTPQSWSASSYSSSASNNNWNYICWQNYFGTDGSGSMTTGDVWMNDIYISHGTPARVEIADSSTWSNRKTCIIQPPSSWNSNGQSITITVNQGSFASGSAAYLYVVDSSGNVNANGYPITIGGQSNSGGSSSDTTAPSVPSGVKVILVQ